MKLQRISDAMPCPCGGSEGRLSYGECCGRWHRDLAAGHAGAPTPEALMRSRYSAYALQCLSPAMGVYLLATWHASTAPGEIEPNPFMQWLGLELRHAASSGDAGMVEFIACYKDNGRAGRLHETSRFVRLDGRWLYIDGEQQ